MKRVNDGKTLPVRYCMSDNQKRGGEAKNRRTLSLSIVA